MACTSLHTQDYVNNVLEYFVTVSVSKITNKMRYVQVENHVKMWSLVCRIGLQSHMQIIILHIL